MPLHIEKAPIVIVGMGTPMLIGNMLAHRLVDDDTSRIMLLSTVGAELNTLQHFGHNSRKISIRGRINLTLADDKRNTFNPFIGGSRFGVETILTGLKILKETKSAVLVIMNHSICYGIISHIRTIDDREYPTSFDYECEIIEKDLYGLKVSAIAQRILSGIVARITTDADRKRFVEPESVIPDFSDLRG